MRSPTTAPAAQPSPALRSPERHNHEAGWSASPTSKRRRPPHYLFSTDLLADSPSAWPPPHDVLVRIEAPVGLGLRPPSDGSACLRTLY